MLTRKKHLNYLIALLTNQFQNQIIILLLFPLYPQPICLLSKVLLNVSIVRSLRLSGFSDSIKFSSYPVQFFVKKKNSPVWI